MERVKREEIGYFCYHCGKETRYIYRDNQSGLYVHECICGALYHLPIIYPYYKILIKTDEWILKENSKWTK